jgi:hypothetical protein
MASNCLTIEISVVMHTPRFLHCPIGMESLEYILLTKVDRIIEFEREGDARKREALSGGHAVIQ